MSKAPMDLTTMAGNRGGLCMPLIGSPSPPRPRLGEEIQAIRAKRKAQRLAPKKAR